MAFGSSSGFGGSGGFGAPKPKSPGLDLNTLLAMSGQQQAPKPGPNFLQSVLDVIDRPRNAIVSGVAGAMGQTGDNAAVSAFKGLTGQVHTNVGDILKKSGVQEGPKIGPVSARGVAGFVGDVLLDPTTYLTAGAGKGAKLALEQGGKAILNGAGTKALRQALEEGAAKGLSADVVRQQFAKALPQHFVDQGGIKLAGQTLVKGKTIEAGYNAAKGIPGVGKVLQAGEAAKNSIGDVFSTGFKARATTAAGEDASNLLSRMKSANRHAANVGTEVEQRFGQMIKKAMPKGFDFNEAVQMWKRGLDDAKSLKDAPDWLKPSIAEARKHTEGLFAKEEPLRLAVDGAQHTENYFPRLTDNTPKEIQTIMEAFPEKYHKELAAMKSNRDPFFLNSRKTVSSTLDDLVKDGEKVGITVKPVDPLKALGIRTTSSERAMARFSASKEAQSLGVQRAGSSSIPEASGPLSTAPVNRLNGLVPTSALPKDAQDLITLLQKSPNTKDALFQTYEKALAHPEDHQALQALSDMTKNHLGASVHDYSLQDVHDLWGQIFDHANFMDQPKGAEAQSLVQAGLPAGPASKITAANPEEATAALRAKGWVKSDAPELDGFVFEPEVAKLFDKGFAKSMPKENALKWFDKAMGLYKGAITSVFPSFHARNKIGNLFNGAYLGGVGMSDLPTYFKDQATVLKGAKEFRVAGQKFSLEDLQRLGVADAGQAATEGFRSATTKAGKVGEALQVPLNAGRKLGSWVENPDRIALFLHQIRKGESVSDAVAHVNKFLFNYSDTSKVVSGANKLIPFFTWTSKNIPLQLEMLAKNPGKYNNIASAFREGGMGGPGSDSLPEYAKEGLYAVGNTSKDQNGNDIAQVFRSFGLPLEDLQRLYRGDPKRTFEREVLGSLTPALRLPAELSTGQDFYRGDTLNNLDSTYGNKAKNLPDWLKSLVGYREETYTDKQGKQHTIPSVDPEKYKILDTLPTSRLQDLVMTPRNANDPAGQQVQDVLAKAFSPLSTSNYNLTASQAAAEKKQAQTLIDALVKKGLLKQYTNTYVPTTKKKTVSLVAK